MRAKTFRDITFMITKANAFIMQLVKLKTHRVFVISVFLFSFMSFKLKRLSLSNTEMRYLCSACEQRTLTQKVH